MTKKFLIVLLSFCFCAFMFSVNVDAMTYSDNNQAGYAVNNPTTLNLNSGIVFHDDKGVTKKGTAEYAQHVNVLELNTTENAKIVSWAVKDSSNSGFVRKTLTNIAKDYEANHPGWKVIGGMNADQYFTKFGTSLGTDGSDYFYPSPYYPMIADGEKWFAMTSMPSTSGKVIGFTNDGSEDQLHYFNAALNYSNTADDKAKISGLYLTIAGDVTKKFKIEKINQAPGANESALYSPYYTGATMPALNVTGTNLFVVSKADLAYMNNSVTFTYKAGNNFDSFFGKGYVTSKETSFSLNKGQFAIDTTNPEILEALKVDSYITVQFEFEGLLNTVESAIGFHTVMRNNGKDVESTAVYNTKAYPRAIVGRKADGTIMLVAIDGNHATSGRTGTDQNESNAVLKHYGVVEAYQMDGGGSVTMIIRDGNDFKTVNNPSDGSDRQILSGLFYVVKSPEIEGDIEVESDKLEFNITKVDSSVGDLYVKLGDETKKVENKKVVFSNLKPNTEYQYSYWYYDNGVFIESVINGKIMTAKRIPKVESVMITKSDTGLSFDIIISDPDNAILRQSISFNGVTQLITKRQIEFTNVKDIDLDSLAINISYDLNDGNSRQDLPPIKDVNRRMNLVVYMMFSNYNVREKLRGIYE